MQHITWSTWSPKIIVKIFSIHPACPLNRLIQRHVIKRDLFSVLLSFTDGVGTVCKYSSFPAFPPCCLSLGCWQHPNTERLQFRTACYSTTARMPASREQEIFWHREVVKNCVCLNRGECTHMFLPTEVSITYHSWKMGALTGNGGGGGRVIHVLYCTSSNMHCSSRENAR